MIYFARKLSYVCSVFFVCLFIFSFLHHENQDNRARVKSDIVDLKAVTYGYSSTYNNPVNSNQDMSYVLNSRSEFIYEYVSRKIKSGMSPRGLWASAQLESSGNPDASNGRYVGLINIGEQEFKIYGPTKGNRRNPSHNLIAASNYIKRNFSILREVIGRDPTDAELYMSLQQGASGFSDLLMNSNKIATKVRGKMAIVGNVPDYLKKQSEKWTCSQFIEYWTNRFNNVMSYAPRYDI